MEAVIQAIKDGDEDLATNLVVALDNNIAVDALDAKGRAAIHYASANRMVPVIWALVDRGSNINLRDTQGKTPLHYAVDSGRVLEQE